MSPSSSHSYDLGVGALQPRIQLPYHYSLLPVATVLGVGPGGVAAPADEPGPTTDAPGRGSRSSSGTHSAENPAAQRAEWAGFSESRFSSSPEIKETPVMGAALRHIATCLFLSFHPKTHDRLLAGRQATCNRLRPFMRHRSSSDLQASSFYGYVMSAPLTSKMSC